MTEYNVDPTTIISAIQSSQPGDVFNCASGVYGSYQFSHVGLPTAPILWRAKPGEHAEFGPITANGADNWFAGLHAKADQIDAVNIYAGGVRVINCVLEGNSTGNGIGAWNAGPEQVVYGNVIYGMSAQHHGIYTQNNYNAYGWKYFNNNIVLDAPPDDSFLFHAYTQTGYLSGLSLYHNIFSSGSFLIGGYNVPHHRIEVDKNVFYRADARLGYGQPIQFHATRNYFGRCALFSHYLAGEGPAISPLKSKVTDNETYYSSPYSNGIRTAPIGSKIRAGTTFNNNKFGGPGFDVWLSAGGITKACSSLVDWQETTKLAGKKLDKDSVMVGNPTAAKVFVFSNDYDPNRLHMAVFNWGLLGSVDVDLGLADGVSVRVLNPKDQWGVPVFEGVYNEPLALPMSGVEFGTYVVQIVSA